MRTFSNWKILFKLLALVGAMSLVIAIVAMVGVHGVTVLDQEAEQVAGSGFDSALGERIHQDVLGLNRAEFRIAADPSPDSLAAAVQDIDARRTRLADQLAEAGKEADPQQAAKLAAVAKALEAYLPELNETIARAKALGDKVDANEARQHIIDAAVESRAEADALGDAVEGYSALSEEEMNHEVEDAVATGTRVKLIMIGTAIIGVLGGLGLGYLMASFAIARPVAASVARLRLLSAGDTDTPITGVERKDEIGEIAATMQVFRENLIRNREMQAREVEEATARARRAQAIEALTENFDRAATVVLRTVASAATELQTTATSMTATAEETARQATVVSGAAEETTANVQTVATATEELSASIHEISNQVTESTRIVGQAVVEAEETNGKVQSLSDAAQKIGDVVRIINEIAGQTNLLALNATIEAARAGEAGKGFAVVASEVKTLATQTARATDEISGQVKAIQDATEGSAQAIRGIGATIHRVNEISTAIASAVEEQGAATQEISRSVQQAAQGTQEVSANIVSVTTAAQETGSAAAQVLEASTELAKQAEVMREEVERYIAGVRAA
jgi:methyl-accepting chemotaxis protein